MKNNLIIKTIEEYNNLNIEEQQQLIIKNLVNLTESYGDFNFLVRHEYRHFELRKIRLDIDNLNLYFINFITRIITVFSQDYKTANDVRILCQLFEVLGVKAQNSEDVKKILSQDKRKLNNPYEFIFSRKDVKHNQLWKALKPADEIAKLTNNKFKLIDLHTHLIKFLIGLMFIDGELNEDKFELIEKTIKFTKKKTI